MNKRIAAHTRTHGIIVQMLSDRNASAAVHIFTLFGGQETALSFGDGFTGCFIKEITRGATARKMGQRS